MKSITAALIKAKSSFPAIHKNKVNPHFKNKYASLDSILEAVTNPLCQAGIVLIQPTIIKDGLIVLSTKLIHADSGETIESELIIPTQSDPQKLGSALTYYRRFSLCTLLAIAADDDDDGTTAVNNAAKPINNTAKADPKIDKAREALRDTMEELDWDATKKIEWAKTINPSPYAQWSLKDWELGLVKARDEIDKLATIPIHY